MLVTTANAAASPTNRWPDTNPAAADLIRDRSQRARELGRELGDALGDPARFARELAGAFKELADPAYRAGQVFVAPGIGPTFGVRSPLQVALRKGFENASRGASTAELLVLADRLLREPERESRWFAITMLQRTIGREPERTWQLLRRAAAEADDWITVDTLAHPFGKGILAEPYRWAELEQLTVSPSRWERSLVGSTVATVPFVNRITGRTPDVVRQGLKLLGTLVGDAEPDVQKALAWGYRSMAMVDVEATVVVLEREAATAAGTLDGHRAWVIRDALRKIDPASAARIRTTLAGVRRRPTDPATSEAAELANRFAEMGLGRRMPEPPLT
jgi:3-methyladenine DNA glycosylase AlkD